MSDIGFISKGYRKVVKVFRLPTEITHESHLSLSKWAALKEKNLLSERANSFLEEYPTLE